MWVFFNKKTKPREPQTIPRELQTIGE